MKRRGWVTIGILVMAVAVGWLQKEFWLPWLPVWGTDLNTWTDKWGNTIQTFADVLASLALVGGWLAAWLGLLKGGDGHLPSIFVSIPDAERAGVLRAEMREKVRRMWIDGVLHKSLYNDVQIELGMQRKDDAVSNRPWQTVIHLPNQTDRPLPPGTSLTTVFAETNRSLLILGEPGSGKTTELLALVEQILDSLEPTSPAHVPVVFNLSSWAEKRLPLEKWLVEELRRNYEVSRKLAETWVADEVLGLFLDGLDEVASEARIGCVAAINAYRNEHGSVPICVCCRRVEYEALNQSLALSGAVLLSPLTRADVDMYLYGLGSEVKGLSQALAQNRELWTLAESPLSLNILTMTYHRKSRAEVIDSLGEGNLERQIFAVYVKNMFVRTARTGRVESVGYVPDKTIHWLGWLAHEMRLHNQTYFVIEHIQPDWYRGHLWVYSLLSWLTVGLGGGMIFGIFTGLGAWLLNGLDEGLNIIGLIGALFIALFIVMPMGLMFGLFYGLISILNGLIFGRLSEEIRLTEVLKIQLKAKLLLKNILYGLAFGGAVGLVLEFSSEQLFDPIQLQILNWLKVSLWGKISSLLFVPTVFGLIFGLISGLWESLIEERSLIQSFNPNERLILSLKNGLIAGLVFGLVFGLIGGSSFGLIFGLSGLTGLIYGLIFGLFFGLTAGLASAGLRYGWSSAIRHIVLRFLLYTNGSIPRNYTRFLDYSSERIFLRKVGGGYIFVHRLLQDYFADGYEES